MQIKRDKFCRKDKLKLKLIKEQSVRETYKRLTITQSL